MMTWEQAWEIHKDAPAEAVHIGWMRTKLSHGYADHPFVECNRPAETCHEADRCHKFLGCEKPKDKHHSDMIPFADLSDEIKAYDYETAIIGFKFGFEAGVASAARP